MENGKQERIIKGLPASGGIAIGPAYVYEREEVYVSERILTVSEVELEIQLLAEAMERAHVELEKIVSFARQKINEEAAAIFESQLLMLSDPQMHKALEKRLRDERKNADFLIHDELEKYRAIFGAAKDELLRDRMADLDEVGQRIMRNLQKKRLHSTVEGEHVIIAEQLTPSDTLLFSRNDVLGYATDIGGITSHAAILSRSLKIPAVTALHGASKDIVTGDMVILDGQHGLLIVNPTEEHQREYARKIERIELLEAELADLVDLPCETSDCHKVELSANAEFVNELEFIITQGSNGIGLYRTEHLYIAKGDFPSEQEQYIEYSEIAFSMYPQPVIFRTFDIGGDKLLERGVSEMNPFLGWRGIRMMLDKTDIFRRQLRAILRASSMKNIKIMFPMISGVAELDEVLAVLADVKNELTEELVPFDEHMEVGLMIEVPSAIFVADELAKRVDFFSIGTNDLVQYLMAVDRNNELIADLYQEFHPAVIRAVKSIIATGHANGIWVGMCGELAGNPLATVMLLGLGLDEFSMVPSVIPEVKKIIRSTSYEDAKGVAETVLRMPVASEVRAYLESYMRERYPHFMATLLNGENGDNGNHKLDGEHGA
ncbi:MAG: phosphoenolpyruvate--protein phosphotransferase [Bacteroidetes bacterium]|nr:phosphoenolpyruvate--protein phosphotransferase [Bacteroidota bacterium]